MKRSTRDVVAVQSADPRALLGAAARPTALAAALVLAGVAVLSAAAWLSVPFYPVPLTMQTLGVLVVAGLLGPRLGVAAVASYLALGLAGAPVFHAGLGGPAVLLGPTGGYLVGFLPAALLMGLLAQRARRSGLGARGSLWTMVRLAAGALLAEAAIYALGVPWLAAAYTGGSLRHAVVVGLLPYLLGDLLKMAVAVGAIKMGSQALGRRGLLPL